MQFSGRFSHFLADPGTSHRHPAEAHLYVQALQGKCFLVEIASRQSTEKDTPLPMIQTDAGVFFPCMPEKTLSTKLHQKMQMTSPGRMLSALNAKPQHERRYVLMCTGYCAQTQRREQEAEFKNKAK